jgi:hypothetical protein
MAKTEPGARPACGGCDGTSFELFVGDFFCNARITWWCDLPHEWQKLQPTVAAFTSSVRAGVGGRWGARRFISQRRNMNSIACRWIEVLEIRARVTKLRRRHAGAVRGTPLRQRTQFVRCGCGLAVAERPGALSQDRAGSVRPGLEHVRARGHIGSADSRRRAAVATSSSVPAPRTYGTSRPPMQAC